MKLFGLVLLLLSFDGCSARVVESFDECGVDAFANINGSPTPPTMFNGNRYKIICQTLHNIRHYVTYYDTSRKIPVYSAFKFQGSKCLNRSDSWLVEPQLDYDTPQPNMVEQNLVPKEFRGRNQALDTNYKKSGYDRGHLAPHCYAKTPDFSKATFTLTNAAPQVPNFNRGLWKSVELQVRKVLAEQCVNRGLEAYVVTGVVPGTQNMRTVTVPSHFWTAFCCLDNNNKPSCSGAYYAENTASSAENAESDESDCCDGSAVFVSSANGPKRARIDKNNKSGKKIQLMEVQQLEEFLTENYKDNNNNKMGAFKVFGSGCEARRP